MFRAAPMAHVTLWLLASEAQDGALLLARHGAFAPAPAEQPVPGAQATLYREVFLEARSRLDKLLEHVDLPVLPIPDDAVAPTLPVLEGVNQTLKEIWRGFSGVVDQASRLQEERTYLAMMRESYARLAGLQVDLSRLFEPDSLLDLHIGTLPAANVPRLGEALVLAGHVLSVFDRHGDQASAVVAGPRGGEGVAGLLSQAGWRALAIPEALRTRPEAAREFLDDAAARLDAALDIHNRLRAEFLDRHQDRLAEARLQLQLAHPLAQAARSGLTGQGQLLAFTGWVPRGGLETLMAALESRFQGRYFSEVRAPEAIKAGPIPSLVRYPGWLRPFVPLVASYGLPRYGEFDPTLPFALGYLLLFGAMFGDVGHGAVLVLLFLLLGRPLKSLRWVGVAAGLSSMGFGFLYGSLFGYEDVLEAVWISPMHDPGRLLGVAIGLGAAFIVLTLMASIHNHLAQGHRGRALGAASGLAGLIFYIGALIGAASLSGLVSWAVPAALLIVVGLAGVALHSLLESHAPWGERLLVMVIETLETGINLFANTLSFMRVAAFSLNHVALALAVFALAQGLGSVGQGVALVLGNAVVIVLEGGIVAIQAMRLMYYEGFSRFFSADGVPFVPLRLAEESSS
ncbi:MAG: V-type ATPase 116kDa subunit family protein [Pseudomonadota bacterium]